MLGPGEPVPLPILERMRDRLAHRGPDGAGEWEAMHPRGSVSLGFRRLAILDTRHIADQPMVSADGRKAIVFNGAIYNFVELREQLEARGRHFRTRGDTEVLLQAYEEWGDAMVERLNGMFSFVLWDQDRGQALVARDRFGEKPLFTCRLPGGRVGFGSEMKALLAHPELDTSYDLDLFGQVLFGRIIFASPETLFRGVRQVPAGHCLVVDADGRVVSDRRYWQPGYDRALGGRPRGELVAEFRQRMESAVRLRMRSDVPVTACLSGGLDSSTLVALLADHGRRTGHAITGTMSVRFPADPTIDEGRFIDAVLERTGIAGHAVQPEPEELARDVRRMHWHHETIVPGPSMYLEWALMREARALGNKVIIDGQGADEVLAGYQSYFQAWQAELAERSSGYALALGALRDRRLRHAAAAYLDPQRRFSQRDGLTPQQLRVYAQSQVGDMVRRYGGDGLPQPQDAGLLRFELGLNLMRTSLPSNLYSGDRNSMAHGIECRYPFLDYELVDFAMHLPDWAYLKDGWGKRILREALPDLLPEEVRWRVDKVGFAAPQDQWLRHPGIRDWMRDRVHDPRLAGIPGHDRAGLAERWEEHQRGQADHSSWLWIWASAAELLDMQASNEWRGQ